MTKLERCEKVYAHDAALWRSGLAFAGIDEAGRGPLAGEVVAGCVVMPELPQIPYVLDSKQLSEKQREAAFLEISRLAVFVGVGSADVEEIETLNILQATKLAMRRAAEGAPAALFLVDAVAKVGLPGEERPIVSGDAVSYSIAAASIIAKVERDRRMRLLHSLYPKYGFDRNKGYGTREHQEALRAFGPCPAHRLSFLSGILSK